MADDDAVRRQNEINMFSAMASGDFSGTFDFGSDGGSFDAGTTNRVVEDEDAGDDKREVPRSDESMRNMFAQAANADVDSSGTFNFSAPVSDSGRLNLEAAAAALDDFGSNAPPPAPAVGATAPFGTSPAYPSVNKIKNRTPMHTQEVNLPRPLFFGCSLPPRVVIESRKIVKEALERNDRLPPGVRNLMSVIRTYGNGISILPGEEDRQPSGYVSAFCPKWSEEMKDEAKSGSCPTEPLADDSSFIVETAQSPSATAESSQEEPTPVTAAGQSSDENPAAMSERDMFSMWAQGDYDDCSTGNASGGSSKSSLGSTKEKPRIQREPSLGSVFPEPSPPVPMSDQDLFSLWARGESPANNDSTNRADSLSSSMRFNASLAAAPKNQDFFNAGTFMNIGRDDDTDDDSVVGSELKKKVGANEHLNAALASLEEDWAPGGQNDAAATAGAMEEAMGLTQVPLSADGARALTNHELMNGCSPLFGVDDSPLPVEGDLGIHETRDEQQRSREQRRNQAIIEGCCPQNLFGPVACPNPALGPDDNHSWNSREAPSLALPGIPSSVGSSGVRPGIGNVRTPKAKPRPPGLVKQANGISSPSPSKNSSAKGSLPFQNRKFDSKSRFGWWNISPNAETAETDKGDEGAEIVDVQPGGYNSLDDASKEVPFVLPPWEHSATTVLIQTQLEPTPEQLHKQNRSLSHLHPATSLAQSIPFLSDRPPSYRYLQIDTQAVGFPSIGGEVEPLFCSLAIYHVETIPHSRADAGSSPLPDLHRCGKITETLNFDVVSDRQVEIRCNGAVWPYKTQNSSDKLQGTRCGVFPLPSNLNIHNLYAILTVSKVVSEGSDFEVYLRGTKPSSGEKHEKVDTELLRSKAAKASTRQGKFLMPFAFGVAPVLQVFGADVPVVPSSRAVQIPLFRFSSGQGERQIIDHIMVMLYPRANHRSSGIGGAAPVTNGGSAMLVMRNFGYLGLHSVIHSKSSLARDRLVDFTGEIQIRRRSNKENEAVRATRGKGKTYSNVRRLSEWGKHFVAEPTTNGGRNLRAHESERPGSRSTTSKSELYAQELAPLPLQASPSNKPLTPSGGIKGLRDRPSPTGDDIEPFFHTTFCNHMLVHPRHLHNCPKGNIVVKVEMRDMEWLPEYSAYSAHLPRNGPSIQNPRRGPFLIQGAFTSCSSRCIDPRFLDEFKVSLPLLLDDQQGGESVRTPSLLFTVYRISFSSRKKWGKRIRGNKRTNRKVEEIAGEVSGEGGDEIERNRACQLIQLGCGFLPLASNFSLLPNGNHDVRMRFMARNPRRDLCEKGHLNEDTLIISESTEGPKWMFGPERLDTEETAEDGESVGSSLPLPDTASATSASDSIAMSESTEDRRQRHNRQKTGIDQMSLQVRICVQSSVHPQNATLCEFMSQEPGLPMSIDVDGLEVAPLLRLSREDIYRSIQSTSCRSSDKSAYDMDKLLISTVDISKSSMCSVSDISSHLLRVIRHLWKIVISGVGEPDVAWANPASIIPLRIQAFATLLQLLGSSTVHLSKRGVTQLDGGHKWSLVSLSRVMSLVFDEGVLYGDQAGEPFVKDFFARLEKSTATDTSATRPKNSRERRRKHVRSKFEFFSNGDGLGAVVDGSGSLLEDGTVSVSSIDGDNPIDDTNSSPGGINSSEASIEASFKWGGVDDDVVFTRESRGGKGGSHPVNNPSGLKIDSVTDFRSALEMGNREVDDYDSTFDGSSSSGAKVAVAMIKAYSGQHAVGKRWMTAPAPGLATIKEDGDGDNPDQILTNLIPFDPHTAKGPLDNLDAEQDYVKSTKGSVKQMRVPKRIKENAGSNGEKSSLQTDRGETSGLGNFFLPNPNTKGPLPQNSVGTSDDRGKSSDTVAPNPSPEQDMLSKHRPVKSRVQTLPTTSEIESSGGSFLDTIEKSLGLSSGLEKSAEKESRVGHAHHRKSESKFCSIDWSIPNDDLSNLLRDTSAEELQTPREPAADDVDDSMSTLVGEKEICTRLPNFIDRLVALKGSNGNTNRWFPFAYEVIILQWAAILSTQRSAEGNVEAASNINDVDGCLSDAASRTSGVVIACAPVLFEIIKQSLGWRVANLFRRMEEVGEDVGAFKEYPALVTLDDTMQGSLEQVVGMITDACLDSRNFDSWETRQTCIDVNDSIIWFLRDLFAFLDPVYVHRLIMIYLNRLVAKDSRHLQDRDSSIGLRCSWEVTKLQMNAISALIRFPDFMKVNSPQMNSVGEWWVSATTLSTVNLFDSLLERYQKYRVQLNSNSFETPSMQPHWLAEIVVEICLLGTEHAEPKIQRRSASLLVELFWEQSQQSMRDGNSSIVASMFITFLEKVLSRVNFLSSGFSAKSQVRQDIVRCVAFVLQSAPSLLLRALWRRLCARAAGRSFQDRYGGIGYSVFTESTDDNMFQDPQRRLPSRAGVDENHDPDIFEMFSLLNLCLASLEYEGSDDHAELDGTGDSDGPAVVWRKDVLLGREQETPDVIRRRRLLAAYGRSTDETADDTDAEFSTSSSRKWIAHDGSLVVARAAQQIVRELRFVLEPSEEAQSFFNPARRKVQMKKKHRYQSSFTSAGSRESRIIFSYMDTVVFVRAATSVLLHALTLRQSDIALVKIFNASVEVIKIFGIKIFNEAVGETLQHWMRVVSFHCGSRRAEVRVPASDFLELILRSTWDSFGSFFRIRLPLLAVQTEVMERIVATAAARHYREQRKMGHGIDLFSNGSAEASLAPLWRTMDRLHNQSASQNVAFRSALIRLAEKLKKLFRAYIAAHALSFLNRSRSPSFPGQENESGNTPERNLEAETLIRAGRISTHRVINATAGYSKQFLGLYSTSASEQSTVAHHEAVEDAFLDAADVFSPTELPDHRVAWLRKLAEFHSARLRYAEEATCHYHIHVTLNQASRLHGALWSSTPFLPWTDNNSDGIHLDGEGPATELDESTDFDEMPDEDIDYGRQIDRTNSFRRIFYRNENSIRLNSGEPTKYAFCGVTLASEYHTVSPWISLREMEATMLEEAEAAGDLFLRSGIVASSRFAWSLATRHYAEKFCYGKLAHVYERLSRTVVSQVPPIDSTLNEVCVTVPLGRFYRVWFHGGAPDELIGVEFVHRSASNVKLDQFGKELKEVIRCIIPDNTPIHLVLDGRPEENLQQHYTGFSRMAGAPLEPVRVKVTPLRPMVRKSSRFRGLPEWFDDYIDTAFSGQAARSTVLTGQGLRRRGSVYSDGPSTDTLSHHRDHARSYSASVFSSSGTGATSLGSRMSSFGNADSRRFHADSSYEGELVGADKFSFMQPINKDRSRGARDWLKGASGDFAEKTLRVTQLQVGQAFPACVSRQQVVHRVVFTQSPLEAAVDAICQWCAILFRTAIATNGMALLGTNYDPGIGIDAAKVVSECIHSSRVKEMGLYLLKKNTNVEEEEDGDVLQRYDRLGEDEVKKLQLKLARSLIVFMELLHLLIARNRDLLLDVIQERKKGGGESAVGYGRNLARGDVSVGTINSDARSSRSFPARQSSMAAHDSASSQDGRAREDLSSRASHRRVRSTASGIGGEDGSVAGTMASNTGSERQRTDSAIGIQSELQRAFISLSKDLHPMILGIMGNSTPRWLKQCCYDNYFSAYTYRSTKIPMGEELAFEDINPLAPPSRRNSSVGMAPSVSAKSVVSGGASVTTPIPPPHSIRTPGSPGGGSLGSGSAVSRGSDAARSIKSLRSHKSHGK